MNKAALVILLGSGVVLLMSDVVGRGHMMPTHIISALALAVLPVYLVVTSMKTQKKDDLDEAVEIMRDVQRMRVARKEVKSKIPKNSPRRESRAAFEGATKVGSARSMATLVRKPRLREKILEICDFADMVLETIRRMPDDTPAATAFADNHLSKLNEALERCFEMSRHDEYKHAPASLDAQEIECFSTFITAFKKQQDNILLEGKN
jgi:hypothetical protein